MGSRLLATVDCGPLIAPLHRRRPTRLPLAPTPRAGVLAMNDERWASVRYVVTVILAVARAAIPAVLALGLDVRAFLWAASPSTCS